jgi:hypothetical protein
MKLLKIISRIIAESIQDFKTYSDALDYVKRQVKTQGQGYYATDEYKNLYPLLKSLRDVEVNKFKSKKEKELENLNLKPGDKIQISWATMWGGLETVEGTLFMRAGIPYVKLPHKLPVNSKGKIMYKQSVPFSAKNMRKID